MECCFGCLGGFRKDFVEIWVQQCPHPPRFPYRFGYLLKSVTITVIERMRVARKNLNYADDRTATHNGRSDDRTDLQVPTGFAVDPGIKIRVIAMQHTPKLEACTGGSGRSGDARPDRRRALASCC